MSVLRWGLLVAGLVSAALAWNWWTLGAPPLWSLASPRAETVVTRAELVETAGPDGAVRRRAEVEVAWPPGGTGSVLLEGMASPHQRWHLHVPTELVRDHPPGTEISVRIVGGQPVADRTDLYDLAYALLFTLFGAGFIAAAAALFARRWVAGATKKEAAR